MLKKFFDSVKKEFNNQIPLSLVISYVDEFGTFIRCEPLESDLLEYCHGKYLDFYGLHYEVEYFAENSPVLTFPEDTYLNNKGDIVYKLTSSPLIMTTNGKIVNVKFIGMDKKEI